MAAVAEDAPHAAARAGLLRRMQRQAPAAFVAALLLAAVAMLAILGPLVAPHDPAQQFRDAILSPPRWWGGDARFFLGTDDLGRDILSRLIHGARLSLAMGFLAVVLAATAGVSIGLVAGYLRGRVDFAIMRVVDLLMALPGLLLALVVVAVLGPSLTNAMLAIAVVMLPGYIRLVRAVTMVEAAKPHVLASRLAGASRLRLMFIDILPNCASPVIVQATLGLSAAILDAAALGFLGLGAQPPSAEWGAMLATALRYMREAWWMATFPGLCIMLVVLAFNILGDGLRDLLNPRAAP